jgi:radical SAM superfamily enzyme YgiQ (UPF0313 family)
MMRIALVSPATITQFDDAEVDAGEVIELARHVPVGVLTLAAILEREGHQVELIDLNTLYYEHRLERSRATFHEHAAAALAIAGCDVVGLGTICSSYPLTLRVAETLRSLRPDQTIVLGGPQATVVAAETLAAHGAVDFVLRGEADRSLACLLQALERGAPLAEVSGLCYRAGGRACQSPQGELPDLDLLPLPAYALFPALAAADVLPLELGRGCPYGCTFCSTNDFFRRRFRLKRPSLVVEQMRELAGRYHIHHFDLIHDMFTVDRARVESFCRELLDSGAEFAWNCSARTDRVDPELLELMYAAGCRGVFYGIETGSEGLQRRVRKKLDLPTALARVRTTSDLGMRAVASLIVGFPGETEADLRDTVDFFVQVLRAGNAVPQLHLLAPLAGTPIHREHAHALVFDDVFSDMSHNGWEQDPADRAAILAHPELFPNFYAVPTPLSRERLKNLRSFLVESLVHFRWLLIALHEDTHLVEVYERFVRSYMAAHGAPPTAAYFRTAAFSVDFLAHVRDHARGSAIERVLSSLVTLYAAHPRRGAAQARAGDEISSSGDVWRPCRIDDVAIADVEVEYGALVTALLTAVDLKDVPACRQTLVLRAGADAAWSAAELHPIAASLLRRCDGMSTADAIARQVADESADHGVELEPAALVDALHALRDERLLL